MSSPQISVQLKTADDLRRAFLKFFKDRGHTVVPSAPLVTNDPSLLFTTAGMVPFKPYYTATDVPYTRAVSVQKCLRLTDLEHVGTTPRHDTFFEMLGNFSFGPAERGAYFKEEAVAFAWEFLTTVLGLPRDRLYVSIFAGEEGLPRDDEAARIWKKMGLAAGRIVPLGRADNFWGPAGGSGPCGPCSEIYFDLGEKRPAELPEGAFWGERPGDAGDRYMEFWNLVFPQFDARPDAGGGPPALERLARPGIDTGMGLERLALILQNKSTIFETDVFQPLVDVALALAGLDERGLAKLDPERRRIVRRDARIIADHARALTFATAEGVLPGNEGAGYVLRRLLRRAVARGHSRQGLAIEAPSFFVAVVDEVINRFAGHYKELAERRDKFRPAIAREEEAFQRTYAMGLALLEDLIAKGGTTIRGEDAFELHDTYGFPIELTEEIAAGRGLTVDRAGFTRAMEGQRSRARSASKFTKGDGPAAAGWHEVTSGPDSEFVGYTALEASGLTLRRWREHGANELDVVLDRTPAYAESGGQVADPGVIEGGGAEAELVTVLKEGESIVHRVRLAAGTPEALLAAGKAGALRVAVPASHRRPTMRHHTATHLLHAALRGVLGDHVRQAGSLVAPDRLRFDYTHFEAPARAQLEAVEDRVNDWVLDDREVSWRVVPLEEAKAAGAMALFGEKYGAEVRMVTIEGYQGGPPASRELCGGTHVARTGEIGAFVVVSDAAVASGVRRIEALCGSQALARVREREATLERAAATLQSSVTALPEQVEKLKGEVERLRREIGESRRGGLEAELAKLAEQAAAAPGGRWIVARVATPADPGAVRDAADALRARLGRGAIVLAVTSGDKLTFVAAVTDDLVAAGTLRADELVRAVARVAGGSGGGKPHLALAGAKEPGKVDEALAEARRLLSEALGA
jgi:alanyl-tRNA synthetase